MVSGQWSVFGSQCSVQQWIIKITNKKTIKKGCLNLDVSLSKQPFSRRKLIKNYALASVRFVFFQKTNHSATLGRY